MAITTYTELQQIVADTLERADIGDRIPDGVTLFEAEANKRLRTRNQQTSTTLTATAGSVSLPSDYLAWRTVLWTPTTPDTVLEWVDPEYLDSTWVSFETSTPILFTIEGATLKIRPAVATASAIEFHYFQKIAALASGVQWLFQDHPDVYLVGTLAECVKWVPEKADKKPEWIAERDRLLGEIALLSAQTQGATSPQVRSDSYF